MGIIARMPAEGVDSNLWPQFRIPRYAYLYIRVNTRDRLDGIVKATAAVLAHEGEGGQAAGVGHEAEETTCPRLFR
jgi:hypothetical protein